MAINFRVSNICWSSATIQVRIARLKFRLNKSWNGFWNLNWILLQSTSRRSSLRSWYSQYDGALEYSGEIGPPSGHYDTVRVTLTSMTPTALGPARAPGRQCRALQHPRRQLLISCYREARTAGLAGAAGRRGRRPASRNPSPRGRRLATNSRNLRDPVIVTWLPSRRDWESTPWQE